MTKIGIGLVEKKRLGLGKANNKTNSNKTEYSDTDFNNTSPRSPSKTNEIKENFHHQKQDPEVEENMKST
ncbi:hypothetical protein IX293_002260 [Fusobacterium necrophorum]|nr:hypothetical protein [Fusobacterium necrophorum]